MTAANKIGNSYAAALDVQFYRDTPKAVLAAVLVSTLLREGWILAEMERAIINEWDTLHTSAIIPQPIKPWMKEAF